MARVIANFEPPEDVPGSHQTFAWSGFIQTNAAVGGDVLQTDHGWIINGGLVRVMIDAREATPTGWTVDVILRPGAPNTILPRMLLRAALDVLAVQFDTGFEIHDTSALAPPLSARESKRNRPVVSSEDLRDAMRMGSVLQNQHAAFSRSLGWFRRGISSVDEAMAYMGIWNAVEVMAREPHTKKMQDKLKTKGMVELALNKAWNGKPPFRDLDLKTWISERFKMRCNIAHGLIAITEHEMRDLIKQLHSLRIVIGEYLSAVLYSHFPKCKSKKRSRLPNDF